MRCAAALPGLLLCILHLPAGASAKPHYMVLFPSIFYYPYTGKVLVHLLDLDAPVRVTLHLESSHGVPDLVLEEQGSDVLQLNWPRFSNFSTQPAGFYELAYFEVTIQGGSLQVFEKKQVIMEYKRLGTLVQTDKDVYKPGETVKFRIVRFNQNLVPSDQKIRRVAVQDPSGKRVAQWRKLSPRQGIVDLSLRLAAKSALGTYTIEVEERRHSFSVKDHGLRPFEVLIQLPRVVSLKDEKIPLDVCGWYSSGNTFRGRAEARLCQYIPDQRVEATRICAEFRGQTGRDGCFSTEVPVASFDLAELSFRSWLYAYASLQEEGTGIMQIAAKSCRVVSEVATITFETFERFYKPGIPSTGTLLLKGTNGAVLKEEEFLLVVNSTGEVQRKTLLTDGSGRASFELDTSGWSSKVSLHGELKDGAPASKQEGKRQASYQSVVRYLYPFASNSKTFLKIRRVEKKLPCGHPHQLQVDYFIDEVALGIQLRSLDMVFLALAKGTVVTILRKELRAEAGLRGSFSLELPIGPELAPRATVLGYAVLPDGEMVADSSKLDVAKCFPNKVSLSFSEQRALVGSRLHLKLQADPGSLCAVYAVEQHRGLSSSKLKLNPSTVYNSLPAFYEDSYPLVIDEPDPPRCWLQGYGHPAAAAPASNCFDTPGIQSWRRCLHRRMAREAPVPDNQPGSATLIKDASLKFVTNSQVGCVSKPLDYSFESLLYPEGAALNDIEQVGVVQDTLMEMDSLRTWLWELVPVREGGSTEVTVTVPDAITQWEAGMFCTSPLGFGLAPATTLTAFKPFSLELVLPHIVVHHEPFTLVATVFNSLEQCLRVQVTLAKSSELEVLGSGDEEYSDCICGDEARTFRWSMRATGLGEVIVTVTAKTLRSDGLCGTEMPVIPTQGQVNTKTRLLKVQLSRLM